MVSHNNPTNISMNPRPFERCSDIHSITNGSIDIDPCLFASSSVDQSDTIIELDPFISV